MFRVPKDFLGPAEKGSRFTSYESTHTYLDGSGECAIFPTDD